MRKNGHQRGETITQVSNAVPISLLVKTNNLVDRKVTFSLILPPLKTHMKPKPKREPETERGIPERMLSL